MNKKISIMIIIVLLFSFAFPTLNSIATNEIITEENEDIKSEIREIIDEIFNYEVMWRIENFSLIAGINNYTDEYVRKLAFLQVIEEIVDADSSAVDYKNEAEVDKYLEQIKAELNNDNYLEWINNLDGDLDEYLDEYYDNNFEAVTEVVSEKVMELQEIGESGDNTQDIIDSFDEMNEYKQDIKEKFDEIIAEIMEENGQDITAEFLVNKNADKLSTYLGGNYEDFLNEEEINELNAYIDGLLQPYNTSSEDLSQMRTVQILDSVGLVVDGVLSVLAYPFKVIFFILPGLILTAVATGVSNLGGNYDGVLTIDKLLFNEIPLTSIDIFNKDVENNVLSELRSNIANWYYVLRNLSIIIALCVLIYIGIRMAMASMAEPKAKYKKLLKDWCVGIILIFALHYIIIGVITLNNALVSVLADVQRSSGAENMLGKLLGDSFKVSTGFLTSFATAAIYLMFVGMTFAFLIMYIKRMITISFLIVIAPLITVTYAIDKANDGKAQALDTWLKEFIYNVLIQPFHCIIYLSLVSGVYELLQDASAGLAKFVIAIMMMMFLFKAENIVRSIFGFSKASSLGTAVKSMAGVMAGYKLAQNITGKATGAIGKIRSDKYKPKLKENTAPESKGVKVAKKVGKTVYANPKIMGAITSATLGAASGDASTAVAAGYAGYTAGSKIQENIDSSRKAKEVKDKKEEVHSEYNKTKQAHPELTDDKMEKITSDILKTNDINKVKNEYKTYAESVYSLRDKFKSAGIDKSDEMTMKYIKELGKEQEAN